MKPFQPDYNYLIDAAYNREAKRLPLYEHGIDAGVIEKITGEPVWALLSSGSYEDKLAGQKRISDFCVRFGYDCVPFERCIVHMIQGGRALMGHAPAIIKTMDDLEKYPWDKKTGEFIQLFQQDYDALRAVLPEGMKVVGGIGSGMFETIQDFVPFQELAFLRADDPEVYELLWQKIGDLMFSLWQWLLRNYADSFAVCRFGDDLGFRSSTLIQPDDIRRYIIPQYKRVIDLVHSYNKPFLFHSCGKIYDVMDDLIAAGIDAKHSNEDAIDTFDVWVERYGDRIGNFGGIEMNIMTLNTPEEVKAYIHKLLPKIEGHGGIAIGTGNQISSYTEPANFIAMTEAVREWRGE